MRYFRCKCGKHTAWSSMGVRACDGCDACKTTLAEGPDGHGEIAPHDWREMWKAGRADEAPQKERVCLNCQRREDAPAVSSSENPTNG